LLWAAVPAAVPVPPIEPPLETATYDRNANRIDVNINKYHSNRNSGGFVRVFPAGFVGMVASVLALIVNT